jgi:hypothetical protein
MSGLSEISGFLARLGPVFFLSTHKSPHAVGQIQVAIFFLNSMMWSEFQRNYVIVSYICCLCWKENSSILMSLLGDIVDKLDVADERHSKKNSDQ